MKKKITLLALCLLLPASALAVTEGAVEPAPAVEMESVGVQDAEISYLPDASYYAGYGDWYPAWENAEEWVESEFDGECYYDVEQRPRLTAGETARAKKLLAAWQAGEIAYEGESVLDKMEDVIVGVYALDPEAYDGEQAFVLLPGPCLTDDQLLAIIDAFDQLGLTFDPTKLSERNCARGGGIEANRFLNEEERKRYQNLARLIERGLLDVSSAGEVQALNPKLDSRYFCGLPDFTIRPYRAATDEEFVAMLAALGYHDMTDEINYDGIEKESRALLNGRLGAALSMELSHVYNEGGYTPIVFNRQGSQSWQDEMRRSYGASFTYHTQDGILVYANTAFDWETKEIVDASVMHSKEGGGEPMPDNAPQITDEQIRAAISGVESRLGISGVEWHVLAEDATWTNWGECIPVRAQIEENYWMTIYIGRDDGCERGLCLERGTLVDVLPQDVPVNN